MGLTNNSSIKQVLMLTFCTTSAYFIINYGLILYIMNIDYPKKIAYSIATTSIALYALTNLFWGVIRPKIARLEQGLGLVFIFMPVSYLLLMSRTTQLQLIGIAFYVTTASLAILSLTLLVNQKATALDQRQKNNQWYQLVLNAGSVISTIGIALFASNNFKVLLIFGFCIALANVFIIVLQGAFLKIFDKAFFYLLNILILVTFLTYILLTQEQLTHVVLMIAFGLAIVYAMMLAFKAKEKSYLTFLILAATVNTIYWLASTIYSTQFMILLNSDVQNQFLGIMISPLFIKMLDPLANIIFGLGIVYLYKKYTFLPFNMLIVALFSLALSFMILSGGIHLDRQLQTIMIIWPLLACLFFAFAEFIISTNLRALIPTFIKKSQDQSFFMAFLRVSQAIGAVLAYYLTMHFTGNHSLITMNARLEESYLYLVMGVICSVALLTIIIFKAMESPSWNGFTFFGLKLLTKEKTMSSDA